MSREWLCHGCTELKEKMAPFLFLKKLGKTLSDKNQMQLDAWTLQLKPITQGFLHILRHEQHVRPSRPNSITKSGVSVLISNSERLMYFVCVLLQSLNESIKRSWKWWAIGRSLMRVTNSRKNIREWSCRLLARILKYVTVLHKHPKHTITHTHTHTQHQPHYDTLSHGNWLFNTILLFLKACSSIFTLGFLPSPWYPFMLLALICFFFLYCQC